MISNPLLKVNEGDFFIFEQTNDSVSSFDLPTDNISEIDPFDKPKIDIFSKFDPIDEILNDIPSDIKDNLDEISFNSLKNKSLNDCSKSFFKEDEISSLFSLKEDNLPSFKDCASSCRFITIQNSESKLFLDSDHCLNVFLFSRFEANFHQVWEIKFTDLDNFTILNSATRKYLSVDINNEFKMTSDIISTWKVNESMIQNVQTLLYLENSEDGLLKLSVKNNSLSQKWVFNCFIDSSDLGSFENRIAWKANNIDKLFSKENSCVWNEMLNGKIVNKYRVLRENIDVVILYDVAKNIYIKLDQFGAKWGCTIDQIDIKLDSGKWICSSF